MGVRAENKRPFHADSPIAKSRAFSGASDNPDVLRHALILQVRRQGLAWSNFRRDRITWACGRTADASCRDCGASYLSSVLNIAQTLGGSHR